jgi:hypothetical protein
MLNSTVLEVAIGLVLCFGAIAFISSSIYESIASLLKLRASTLLAGVKDMLNDQQFDALAKSVYQHALVNPRAPSSDPTQRATKPSYIDSRHFAVALIDSVQKASATPADLKAAIDGVVDPQLKVMLQGMYARAAGDAEKLRAEVATWFDAGMDRVSGGYKRKAQLFTFLIALVLAIALNVDTFNLCAALWRHPALVAQLGGSLPANVNQAVASLDALPIGWAAFPRSIPLAAFGWLVTACSALFGAPLWFDLLTRLTNLRGTGKKPES